MVIFLDFSYILVKQKIYSYIFLYKYIWVVFTYFFTVSFPINFALKSTCNFALKRTCNFALKSTCYFVSTSTCYFALTSTCNFSLKSTCYFALSNTCNFVLKHFVLFRFNEHVQLQEVRCEKEAVVVVLHYRAQAWGRYQRYLYGHLWWTKCKLLSVSPLSVSDTTSAYIWHSSCLSLSFSLSLCLFLLLYLSLSPSLYLSIKHRWYMCIVHCALGWFKESNCSLRNLSVDSKDALWVGELMKRIWAPICPGNKTFSHCLFWSNNASYPKIWFYLNKE